MKAGDCLWNIAKKYPVTGSRYTEISELNKDKIKTPNLIFPWSGSDAPGEVGMETEFIIQHGDVIYIPTVQDGVKLTTERKNTPGKLTFKVLNDDVLDFTEGDPVRFTVDGAKNVLRLRLHEEPKQGRRDKRHGVMISSGISKTRTRSRRRA